MQTTDHLTYRQTKYDNAQSDLIGLVEVEINVTELCNRTCSFCPRSTVYPNNNWNMSIETAKNIKAQLKSINFDGSIIFSGFGEPLLHKQIYEITSLFSDYNTELITSGDALLSGKVSVDKLFTCGVKTLIINDYDDNPVLREYAERWYPSVRIRNHHDTGGVELFEEYNFNNRGGTLWKLERSYKRPCFVSAYRMVIDWDGTVLLCDHDWSKSNKLGNINDETITNIWYSDSFARLRRALYSGDRDVCNACKNCSIMGNVLGEKYANLWLDSGKIS